MREMRNTEHSRKIQRRDAKHAEMSLRRDKKRAIYEDENRDYMDILLQEKEPPIDTYKHR